MNFFSLIPLVGQISLFPPVSLEQSEVLPTLFLVEQSEVHRRLFLVDQSEVLPTLFLGKKAVEGVLVFDRRVRGLKGEKQ